MPGHHIDAEQLARIDHVLAFGPERRGRTLPGVAAVEQQRAGATRLELLHQRCEMGETADLAVGPGCLLEIEVSKGVGLGRAGLDAEMAQQRIADQVGRPAGHARDAEIYIRLAEPQRHQLRVAVGEVQQMYVAEARQIV